MTSAPTHGRRTDAVANHTRILSAARAVFAERGLDMEVNEIAERAGVGVGTLYRHFANRDDMVCAILMQTFEDEADSSRRADDWPYGMAGAVFTEDVAKANRVIRKVRAGITWINT